LSGVSAELLEDNPHSAHPNLIRALCAVLLDMIFARCPHLLESALYPI
jgi:hypothetical protein